MGERWGGREKHQFVVPFIYALIGWFLNGLWPGIEPSTLAYRDGTLTNWATQAGPGFIFSFSSQFKNKSGFCNHCQFSGLSRHHDDPHLLQQPSMICSSVCLSLLCWISYRSFPSILANTIYFHPYCSNSTEVFFQSLEICGGPLHHRFSAEHTIHYHNFLLVNANFIPQISPQIPQFVN